MAVDLPQARRLQTDTTIMVMMTPTNMAMQVTVMADMVIMTAVVLIMRLPGRMVLLVDPRDLLAEGMGRLPWTREVIATVDIPRAGMGVAAAAPVVVGDLPLLGGAE